MTPAAVSARRPSRHFPAAVHGLGEPVVAAPAGPQSGVSRAVTTDAAVRVEARGDGRFVVHGTPADCVRVGLHQLCPDAGFVLSGINHGGNLGAEYLFSAPVAAWGVAAADC